MICLKIPAKLMPPGRALCGQETGMPQKSSDIQELIPSRMFAQYSGPPACKHRCLSLTFLFELKIISLLIFYVFGVCECYVGLGD